MAFINAHIAEVGSAVISAPSFLSGLTHAELGDVKHLIEERVSPEIAAAKKDTTEALSDAEAGWRAAVRQISARGGRDAGRQRPNVIVLGEPRIRGCGWRAAKSPGSETGLEKESVVGNAGHRLYLIKLCAPFSLSYRRAPQGGGANSPVVS